MQIRTHIGISLDGFAATPDGKPAWESTGTFVPGESHGNPEVLKECEAVAMGRTSFDQGYELWIGDWPYEGKKVYVLTSRPLPADVRPDVFASEGGPAGLVEQLRGAGLSRDVLVLGGPRTIRALFHVGGIDLFGIVVLPVVLGEGIPLFDGKPTSFESEAWAEALASTSEPAPRPLLPLESHRAFPDGAIEVVYRTG